MNISHFLGRLTKDPEVNTTTGGTQVCKFTLAINGYKRKDHDKPDVAFANFVAFGKTGDAIASYLTKGMPVIVHCSLKQDNWEDKNTGQKRTQLSFVVSSFEFVPGNNKQKEQTTTSVENEVDNSDSSIPF